METLKLNLVKTAAFIGLGILIVLVAIYVINHPTESFNHFIK